MTTLQFILLFMQQVVKIVSHLATSNVQHISSCRFLEAGFNLEHMNGLDLDP
jgi:hypothetical protein